MFWRSQTESWQNVKLQLPGVVGRSSTIEKFLSHHPYLRWLLVLVSLFDSSHPNGEDRVVTPAFDPEEFWGRSLGSERFHCVEKLVVVDHVGQHNVRHLWSNVDQNGFRRPAP